MDISIVQYNLLKKVTLRLRTGQKCVLVAALHNPDFSSALLITFVSAWPLDYVGRTLSDRENTKPHEGIGCG